MGTAGAVIGYALSGLGAKIGLGTIGSHVAGSIAITGYGHIASGGEYTNFGIGMPWGDSGSSGGGHDSPYNPGYGPDSNPEDATGCGLCVTSEAYQHPFADYYRYQTEQMDRIQQMLDYMSYIPGVGIVAAGVNAGLSAARGQHGKIPEQIAAGIPGSFIGKIGKGVIGAAKATRGLVTPTNYYKDRPFFLRD